MKLRLTSLSILALAGAWNFAADARAETVFKVWHRGSQDLLNTLQRVDGLDVSFAIQGPTHVFISGHVDVMHRCLVSPKILPEIYHKLPHKWAPTAYPIGIGARLEHVDQTGVSRWVQGSKWGPNIASCEHHYVTIPLDGYLCLTAPGTHRVSFWATAHSSANDYNGIAEISPASDSDSSGGTNDPYNQMIVRIVPAAQC
jgi:hypothetical protein